MKTIKPIMLVVAGMAIAFLVSFKSQEQVKEFCKIEITSFSRPQITIYYKDTNKIIYPEKGVQSHQKLIEIISNLNSEGWEISTSNAFSFISSGTLEKCENIYLERTKQ